MRPDTPRLLIALASLALSASAFADDCAPVKSAMLNSGHTPHSLTLTKTDGQGKKTVTHQVQTLDNKYVQSTDGKWYAMNIAIKDLNNDLSGILACRRSGSDTVDGQSTAVYEVHMNLEGETGNQKMWVSSTNLILQTERSIEGGHYTIVYDFAHAAPGQFNPDWR